MAKITTNTDDSIRQALLATDIRGLDVRPTTDAINREIIDRTNRLSVELKLELKAQNYLNELNRCLTVKSTKAKLDLTAYFIVLWSFVLHLDDIFESDIQELLNFLKSFDELDVTKWSHLFRKFYTIVMSGVRPMLTTDDLDHIRSAVRKCLIGFGFVRLVRARGKYVEEDRLKNLKLQNTGSELALLLMKIDNKIVVDNELANESNWCHFHKHIDTYLSLVNDIYSLKKVVIKGVHKINWVYIKMVAKNVSAQRAMDLIVEECLYHKSMVDKHGQLLKESHSEPIRDYVESIMKVMDDWLYWSATTDRYKVSADQTLLALQVNGSVISKERFLYSSDGIIGGLLNDIEDKEVKKYIKHLQHIYEHNVMDGKQNRVKVTLKAYDMLCEDKDPVVRELAFVIACCVEMNQSYYLIIDDVMDESETRRGKPCWYKVVGNTAINDGFLLLQHVYQTIITHFAKTGSNIGIKIREAFDEISLYAYYGEMLDMKCGTNIEHLNRDLLVSLHKYKTAYNGFALPVKLAAILCGKDSTEDWPVIESIFLDFGYIFQIQDDFIDCFGDPIIIGKVGTDIENGKFCWNAMKALQHCSEQQRKELLKNYAINDKSCVDRVKQIYYQLNLDKHLEEEFAMMIDKIEQQVRSLDQIKSKKFIDVVDYMKDKYSSEQKAFILMYNKQKHFDDKNLNCNQ